MSSEEQIQVTISPDQIRAETAESIDIRLTNTGPGRCTNVTFSVRLQSGLVLLKGINKIQRNALAAGESFSASLRVRASQPGRYRLTSPSFSYQDHRGLPRNVKDFSAEVIVGPGRQTVVRPQLSAELLTKQLERGKWDILRGIITNVGEANAFEVSASLSSPAITAEGGGRFVTGLLMPGSSEDLTFHVLARDAGVYVPIRLDLSYRGPDGQWYDDEKKQTMDVGHDHVRPRKMMKILFLGANPPGLPSLRIDKEMREIVQEIRLGRERDSIQIETRWAIRSPDISRALLDVEPDLVHFSGHGGGGEESFIVEDATGKADLVPVNGLVNLFKVAGKNVRCLLVNACNTERLAIELSAALPHAYVIGMREPVADPSAIWFSVGFYQAMAAGRPVEEAFDLGKTQMMMAHGSAAAPALWRGSEEISAS